MSSTPNSTTPATPNNILIFGGSFDPPHRGHIELPALAAQAINADTTIYIPAGSPPHKTRQLAPAHHRINMLKLMLEDQPNASIDPYETQQQGPSYTVNTLEHLRERFGPRVKLHLLMGADMAAIFYEWYKWSRILELAEPIVMMRPPDTTQTLLDALPADLSPEARQAWADRIIPITTLDAASTDARQLLSQAQYDHPALTQTLHPHVIDYIKQHQLYL